MKQTGIALLISGALLTGFAGFKYVTKEKVVDIGKIEITTEKNHFLAWSPFLGLAIMIAGGGVLLYGIKKQR
jgi:hypothetical protein